MMIRPCAAHEIDMKDDRILCTHMKDGQTLLCARICAFQIHCVRCALSCITQHQLMSFRIGRQMHFTTLCVTLHVHDLLKT